MPERIEHIDMDIDFMYNNYRLDASVLRDMLQQMEDKVNELIDQHNEEV